MNQVIDLAKAIEVYSSNRDTFLQKIPGLESKEVVLVLGRTQTGKSTFINFLKNINMLSSNDDFDIVLKKEYQEIGFKIGDGSESCTGVPNILELENMVFIDCPGFGDTDVQNELPNAAYIKYIATKSKSVKLLLLVSANVFTRKLDISRSIFMELFNFTGQSFLQQLSKSLILVLTRTERNAVLKLNGCIQQHVTSYEFQNKAKEPLYRAFFSQITQTPIYFYKAEQDSIGNTESEKNAILQRIRSLTPCDKPMIDQFNAVISFEVQTLLSNHLTDYKTQAVTVFQQIAEVITNIQCLSYQELLAIVTKIRKLIQELTSQTSYELLQIEVLLNEIATWSRSINYTIPNDKLELMHKIQGIFSFYSCFKYCIEALKGKFDFNACFLQKMNDFLIKLQSEILIIDKNEELKQNELKVRIEEQKVQVQIQLTKQSEEQFKIKDLEYKQSKEKQEQERLKLEAALKIEQGNIEKIKIEREQHIEQNQQNSVLIAKLQQEAIDTQIQYELETKRTLDLKNIECQQEIKKIELENEKIKEQDKAANKEMDRRFEEQGQQLQQQILEQQKINQTLAEKDKAIEQLNNQMKNLIDKYEAELKEKNRSPKRTKFQKMFGVRW